MNRILLIISAALILFATSLSIKTSNVEVICVRQGSKLTKVDPTPFTKKIYSRGFPLPFYQDPIPEYCSKNDISEVSLIGSNKAEYNFKNALVNYILYLILSIIVIKGFEFIMKGSNAKK